MCNACGFYCCAADAFEGCGCEDCPNEACWPDDVWADEDEGPDYEPDELAAVAASCRRHPPLRCEAILDEGAP